MRSALPINYKLRCLCCQQLSIDDGMMLECPGDHEPALLIAEYPDVPQLVVEHSQPGLFRYHRWLPIRRTIDGTARSITYQSPLLNHRLGLPQLWISFNGYWPEKGADFQTATFKELEADTVLSRIPDLDKQVLVVASAGNTAAAFAHVCSRTQTSCLIILPENGLYKMQFSEPLAACVKVVVLKGFVDYYDAIELAQRVTQHAGFISEGGIKNVARRGGMGTVLLSALEVMSQLPTYYFQAVGSGAGAIAVHEGARRLLDDRRFGSRLPRLMLSQNLPFVPIYQAWQTKRREFIAPDREEGKLQLRDVAAHVLANQRPPYTIRGGVFDALCESKGEMFVASNRQVYAALRLFEECEGIDIDPASGVALATLAEAAASGFIDRNAPILLNISGGGWKHKCRSTKLLAIEPALSIDGAELYQQQAVEMILNLF